MAANESASPLMGDPLADVERHLIGAYVAGEGENLHDLLLRDDEEARALLAAASRHASATLSEIEARWHYLHSLHGDV